MDRHSRQSRLADVGRRGQERIARVVASVPGTGLAAMIAARYLAGAGVAVLRVKDAATASAGRAVDRGVRVEIDPGLPAFIPEAEGLEVLDDPATRRVAAGSLVALGMLRAALAPESS
jgi:hypothetical protein